MSESESEFLLKENIDININKKQSNRDLCWILKKIIYQLVKWYKIDKSPFIEKI